MLCGQILAHKRSGLQISMITGLRMRVRLILLLNWPKEGRSTPTKECDYLFQIKRKSIFLQLTALMFVMKLNISSRLTANSLTKKLTTKIYAYELESLMAFFLEACDLNVEGMQNQFITLHNIYYCSSIT